MSPLKTYSFARQAGGYAPPANSLNVGRRTRHLQARITNSSNNQNTNSHCFGGSDMQVALTALWLPILLSALAVYIASSLIWTVIQYHGSDWRKLPDEDAARSTLKGVNSD